MATNQVNLNSDDNKDDNNNEDEKNKKPKLSVLESQGYVVGEVIDVGTYGTVRIADSTKHGCRVAIKILSKYRMRHEKVIVVYDPRETEVVKGLRHENLIRYYEALETPHKVYIVMEYAENGSLYKIIKRESRIDETRSRRWYHQLLSVLNYCHERGVVHRDVKCENLLIDRYYNLKLSDFGLARGLMKFVNGVPPICNTFCGSFAYASPELLRNKPYQPQLSDVWASGVVLYTMVFGSLPFEDDDWAKLIKQVHSKIVFPKKPEVSKACRKLILRILVPQAIRPGISEILTDPWFSVPADTAQTSSSSSTPFRNSKLPDVNKLPNTATFNSSLEPEESSDSNVSKESSNTSNEDSNINKKTE